MAGHGAREVEALAPVATEVVELRHLFWGFHALGSYFETKCFCQVDDGTHDFGVFDVDPQIADERAVDF
jgi:hypothetical protein